MFKFHNIIEGWLLDASEKSLASWKAALTRAHLKSCARCQRFALELAQFTDDLKFTTGHNLLKGDEAIQLHARIMTAFHRERSHRLDTESLPKLRLRRYFGVTPHFAKAMGLVILAVGLIVMLTEPGQKPQPNFSVTAAQQPVAQPPSPTLSPTPTLTPSPMP